MAEHEPTDEQMLAYRRKHFAVEVSPSRTGDPTEMQVAVTHNGNQWHSLLLLPHEADAVIAAVQKYRVQHG